MTTPAPPAQQPAPQQQATLALAVAEALSAAVTVAGAMTVITPVLVQLGIKAKVAEAALGIVMGHPPEAAGFYGPATANVARINLIRRAMFVAASIFRLTGDDRLMEAGAGAGYWTRGVERERGFYGQQLVAGWNREKASAAVDSASMDHGRLLGWYSKRDRKTSPECRMAHGANFYADQMPSIGYPGMVHPNCRCEPGPPFPGARIIGPATVMARGRSVSDHRPQHHPARTGAGR